MSAVMPTIVRNISAVYSNENLVIPPPSSTTDSLLAASSLHCLSGSTFPDSDAGYFGSVGLYEGSCDHLASDYECWYSAELDDIGVFTESAATASCSRNAVDTRSQNVRPDRSKQFETCNKEVFGIASVGADVQSSHIPHVALSEQHDSVTASDLPHNSLCQAVYFPTNTTVPDKPPAADATGLSEVAGRYTAIRQLLEMNQQRAGLGNAVVDHLSTRSTSSAHSDPEVLVSLAANYCVVNECLQLGRTGLQQSKMDDDSKHGKTLPRECTQEPQPIEVSDISYDLLSCDQTLKDVSTAIMDTELLVQNVSKVLHETDVSSFNSGEPAISASQKELSLMYMATGDTHYYPVYSRLRDIETGIYSTCPYITDSAAKLGGCTTKRELDKHEQRIDRDVNDDKTDIFDGSFASDTAKYLDQIDAHLELSVVHYGSLASLDDVESGKALGVPAHRVPEMQAAAKPQLLPSESNATVRLERLITLASRPVVRVRVEPHPGLTGKDVAHVFNSKEPAVVPDSLAHVECVPYASVVERGIHELSQAAVECDQVPTDNAKCTATFAESGSEPGVAAAAVEQVATIAEMDADAIMDSLNSLEISRSVDVDQVSLETEVTKQLCMPYDVVDAERGAAHYAAVVVLGDVESGRVHNRRKASRFLREWDSENVDDIVAYILGSEVKKHRRKQKHVKRKSESEVSELNAPEVTATSMCHGNSDENVSWVEEKLGELDAVESCVEDQSIGQSRNETEDGSFTVVESRKHRRERHRHDTEEMWAQYLDDVDAADHIAKRLEPESFAECQQQPVCIVAETVTESVIDLSDDKGVVDTTLETVDRELEMVPNTLEVTGTFSAMYATEDHPIGEHEFGLEHDVKVDEDAIMHISAEIHKLVTESVVEVVQQTLSETQIGKSVNGEVLTVAAASAHPSGDRFLPAKVAESVEVEPTLPVSGGVLRHVDNRLYADVARGCKYEADLAAKPEGETPTAHDAESLVRMSAETVEAVSATLPDESDMMAGNNEEFLNKSAEADRAEHLSEVAGQSFTCDVTCPVAEDVQKVAQFGEDLLELPVTEEAAEPSASEWAVEQQQQKAEPAVGRSAPVVDSKSDIELASAECDAAVPSIQLPATELSLPVLDVEALASSSGESLFELSATELCVDSHMLISCAEVYEVGTMSEASDKFSDRLTFAENLELSCSCHTKALIKPAVEPSVIELQSAEYFEPRVAKLAEEAASKTLLSTLDVESTEEPSARLPVAEAVSVLGHAAVTEDEQRVAELFTEAAIAVQNRSALASAAGTGVDDSRVEISETLTVIHSEDAMKKSALSSAESFIAEILPYYYAALGVLHEAERDSMQLPCNSSLCSVNKLPVPASYESTKTSSDGSFTLSTGDQGLSLERESAVVEKEGMPETVLNDTSQSEESRKVYRSDSMSEQTAELSSEPAPSAAGQCLQPELQLYSTVASRDKHLLDHDHADVVASHCYYQSLKLLHFLETGNLSSFSSSNEHGSTIVERAPAMLPVKHPAEESFDTSKLSLVHKAPTSAHEFFKDVSLENNDSLCVHAEYEKSQTISSRSVSSGFPPTEQLTSVMSSAEHDEVEISGTDDITKVLQSVIESHTEREHNMISIDSVKENVDYSAAEPVVDHDTSSSHFFLEEPISKLPIQTADNMIEADEKESQPNVTHIQDGHHGRDNSCVIVGATGNSMQLLPKETVSADLSVELSPNIRLCEVLQQQHVNAVQLATVPNARDDASCFSEQPPDDENFEIHTSTDSKISDIQEIPKENNKKKRKNKRKKPKTPKDDSTHLDTVSGSSDVPPVSQDNEFSENFSSATTEVRHFDDNNAKATASINSEVPDNNVAFNLKKNKKRKRTKKAGQVGADNIMANNSVSEDTGVLSAAAVDEAEQNILSNVKVISEHCEDASLFVGETTIGQDEVSAFQQTASAHSCLENTNSQSISQTLRNIGLPLITASDVVVHVGLKLPDRTLNSEELVPSVSPAYVTVMPNEDDVKNAVDVEVCNSSADGKSLLSVRSAKRRNQKKRKPKTGSIPSPSDAIVDSEVDKACDNSVSPVALVDDHERIDMSDVGAEVDEIMTESLEEDTRITDQPLNILSMDDSKGISDPSHYLSPLICKTAGKKKKNTKATASKVVQPCVNDSDFVTDCSTEAKGCISGKEEVIDETSSSNFISATTSVLASTLSVTTELDSRPTDVSQSVFMDGEWKGAKTETQFEIGSGSESSLDEYQICKSSTTEIAAEGPALLGGSKKKKRKRNKQKKNSGKTSFSKDTIDTDLCSLLSQIIKICVETEDNQVVDSHNQPQSTAKSSKRDTSTLQTIQAPKAARKPRKYKRSKPIRLPPDVAECSEPVSSATDKNNAYTTLQSTDTQHLKMRSETEISRETISEVPGSLKLEESPSHLLSTEGVVNLSDDPGVTQHVEETDIIIAWSASASKMSNSSTPDCLWPRLLQDQVDADANEDQATNVFGFAAPKSESLEDVVTVSDYITICPSEEVHPEPHETCFEDQPRLTTDAVMQDGIISQDIAGCLTADVFTVISEHKNVAETSDIVNLRSEPNDDSNVIKSLTVLADDQQVPDADNDEITDQNSNRYWFDGGGLLHAPTPGCETSSVDSEVERIFAGQMTGDGSSLVEEEASSYSGKDDDELALEDDDLVVTEYVDVEIIEETETVRVLDNDDDLQLSASDRHYSDIDATSSGPKYITSGISSPFASSHVKEITKDVKQFQQYCFRLHEDEGEYHSAGLPSHTEIVKVSADKPTLAHDDRGQMFYPQCFSSYSATADRPTMSEEHAGKSNDARDVGLWRFSRKRQYPSDDTSSSDSGDVRQASDESQFVVAQHQPASLTDTVARYPAWPCLASDTQWAMSDAAFADTIFGEQNPERGLQLTAEFGPGQYFTAAVPTAFELQVGPNLVLQEKDYYHEEEELSGDSLNEYSSTAVGVFFREPKTSARTTTSPGRVQASYGETWESCSTDSLDCQAKFGIVIEPSERTRSSTDCISEDSLAESSFVKTEDSEKLIQTTKNVTTSSTVAAGEQRQDVDQEPVNTKPKKFRGVSARFKGLKSGAAFKPSRKRKLRNVTKDYSDSGETDSDNAEIE